MASGADLSWEHSKKNILIIFLFIYLFIFVLLVSFYIQRPVLVKSIQPIRRVVHVVSLQQKHLYFLKRPGKVNATNTHLSAPLQII